EIMGDYTIPTELAREVSVPTIILDGEASFPFLHETADALATLIPNAKRHTLPGQEHNVDPKALAPVIADFLRS
ncbi:MAG TPA: alpha/beta hydrolase, partial [Acidimicrobiia bacterium]